MCRISTVTTIGAITIWNATSRKSIVLYIITKVSNILAQCRAKSFIKYTLLISRMSSKTTFNFSQYIDLVEIVDDSKKQGWT